MAHAAVKYSNKLPRLLINKSTRRSDAMKRASPTNTGWIASRIVHKTPVSNASADKDVPGNKNPNPRLRTKSPTIELILGVKFTARTNTSTLTYLPEPTRWANKLVRSMA